MTWGLHTKDTPGKGRVLIVDDEDIVRKVLRVTLTEAGYDVVEAEHGGKGIEKIGSDDNPLMVDVIICDIRMPKINGIEAITFFREQYPSVPILVLTGFPDTKMATDLMSKGVFDYLVKPINMKQLQGILSRVMRPSALQAELDRVRSVYFDAWPDGRDRRWWASSPRASSPSRSTPRRSAISSDRRARRFAASRTRRAPSSPSTTRVS